MKTVALIDFSHALRVNYHVRSPDSIPTHAGEQTLAIGCRSHVQIVHHHHPPKRDLLRDLTARTVLGKTLQDAVLRREFSACH